ncbi:MAG: imidazolonepropionase [Chitinophagaceae bacterium]|nr:MAG: imidazolonepropionase [Chitinophagaceae bacterium]
MKLLITNIAQLVNTREQSKVLRGKELAELPIIQDAFLQIENGLIAGYGKMSQLKELDIESSWEMLDANKACILPTWCDSHTHIVFASSREDEFVDKINGLSYAEIAAKGGGILNSAKKIAASSEDALYAMAWDRLQKLIQLGTGAIEIKSG